MNIFNRPQRNCRKIMFLHLSVSHSVHGGVYPSMLSSRHQPPGRHIPACTGTDTPSPPPPRWPLQQTVHIPLECILVSGWNQFLSERQFSLIISIQVSSWMYSKLMLVVIVNLTKADSGFPRGAPTPRSPKMHENLADGAWFPKCYYVDPPLDQFLNTTWVFAPKVSQRTKHKHRETPQWIQTVNIREENIYSSQWTRVTRSHFR